MENDRLKLYVVSENYYKYISKYDSKVPRLSGGKSNRPFIGIMIHVNECDYFAPLTSPKPKHLRMWNTEDFQKIDGGRLGAINFNNMLPVPKSEAHEPDINVKNSDSKSEQQYKSLLDEQRRWCNSHKEQLVRKAQELRKSVYTPEKERLRERCCNFKLLEEKCLEYTKQQEISKSPQCSRRKQRDLEEEL